MKQYTSREFIAIVKKNGYSFVRQNGSHSIFVNSEGRHITIPKNLECVISQRLIKEYKLKLKSK